VASDERVEEDEYVEDALPVSDLDALQVIVKVEDDKLVDEKVSELREVYVDDDVDVRDDVIEDVATDEMSHAKRDD